MLDLDGTTIIPEGRPDVEDMQHAGGVDEQRSFCKVTPGAYPRYCMSFV